MNNFFLRYRPRDSKADLTSTDSGAMGSKKSGDINVVKFVTGNPPQSKRIWKCAVEQHTFFRYMHFYSSLSLSLSLSIHCIVYVHVHVLYMYNCTCTCINSKRAQFLLHTCMYMYTFSILWKVILQSFAQVSFHYMYMYNVHVHVQCCRCRFAQ